ncbi:MAG: TIGR03862 family flavoprotein [Pseudomonadota bacterium]
MNAAVIGAGPAGLMAAEILSAGGAHVTVYDRMPSVGRKFLMAGRGGLNLTHSEPIAKFLTRYGEAEPHLRAAIGSFSPDDLRAWSGQLGQPTFVGSSGRVFPKSFKASPLLRAWLRRLSEAGVEFRLRHRWSGWDGNDLTFETGEGSVVVKADATVLALGGASWPKLGSDGGWADMLKTRGISISPLRPANCGFTVAWSDVFRDKFAGQPLKNIALSFSKHSARGEAMIARDGIEGGAVYAMSAALREEILANGEATLRIALLPDIASDKLGVRLAAARGKQTFSNFLRKASALSPAAIGLLQEAAIASDHKLAQMTPDELAAFINAMPIKLTGIAPLARAISTAGGIPFAELDKNFMLRKLPGVFIAGEMLDWDAPTGGYLLQASFATGVAAGRGALNTLGNR